MSLDKKEFSTYIKQFNFRGLFNDMGWNNDKTTQPIVVDNETYTLQAVAEKSGFKILLCNPVSDGLIPDYNTRKKIETKVTKLFQEHLIIFFDTKKTEQIWQLAVRQTGKPTKITETRWHINQDPELLYQRAAGIFFELDEEENITIIDVTKRIADNFHQNNEKVTKQFYDKFKKEHTAFLSFIKGISDKTNQEWYASLMLNRLMFCYFIQKKGFLDNNKNYLRDKLNACKAKKGKVKFYSFYRNFLLVLFHKGLNEPTQSPDTKIEIGKVPYLNGGLFDEHELEKNNDGIDIDDKAFERLFDFFDQYEWHLDTRHTASGKDINPDVIGYIFEKYINDRAKMGAYYTKEDITEYISKNCIIPYLFDETERKYAKAFQQDSEIWKMLKESGDTYIYDAVKKGIDTEKLDFTTNIDIDDPNHAIWADLPVEVRNGFRPDLKDKIVDNAADIHLWQIRKEWNKSAPENIGLPTEIYRELIDRRKRYWVLRKKIDKGDIQQINDFITYNLNIRQFAQDVVENTNDPELLKHFYKALNSVTIIDPTCGSGAFLFAAMNILEPLYEACLQRMENFVAAAPQGKYKFFEETLAQVKSPEHPNLQYFIYKSIILRNLYGVDIMKEAVEIAKLRLFLKLVATVEADYKKPNLGLEPLPYIDFNIRSGNTLIGYATKKEIDDLQGLFVTQKMKDEILEECEKVSMTFQRFKEIQIIGYENKNEFTKAKTELNSRLDKLADNLNKILHKQNYEGSDYGKWLETHQPFHWFAEFYEIINDKGGFDVIIGNPPYVEYPNKKLNYVLKNYKLIKCGNLYSFIIEKCSALLSDLGRWSMIIPTSSFSTERMIDLRKFITKKSSTWVSFWGNRPGTLFSGAQQNLCIPISVNSNEPVSFSTIHKRWYSEERENIFSLLKYTINPTVKDTLFHKFGNDIELSILNKIKLYKSVKYYVQRNSKHIVYYSNTAGYWLHSLTKLINPEVSRDKTCSFQDNKSKILFCSLINSDLFFWYWQSLGDCYHITNKETHEIGFPEIKSTDTIEKLLNELEKDYKIHTVVKTTNEKTGLSKQEEFYPKKSRNYITNLSTALCEIYKLSQIDTDFILNYDIKYRMGKELENEDEA